MNKFFLSCVLFAFSLQAQAATKAKPISVYAKDSTGKRKPSAASCDDQLAEKDAEIKALQQVILNLSTNKTPVSEIAWTCEAVCVQNLVGKGWHMGQLFRSNVLVTGATPEAAFTAMIQKCNADTQDTFQKSPPGTYQSANVAGILTKAQMNSPDWESQMVKSFDSDPPLRTFCFSNK